MVDNIDKNQTAAEQPSEKTIGRRQLLKALAAAGGAVTAASMLPGQWSKPVVEAGVLPAHAQNSALQIANFEINPATAGLDKEAGLLGNFSYVGTFEYLDPLGKVGDDTKLILTLQGQSSGQQFKVSPTFGNDAVSYTGDGFKGDVEVTIPTGFSLIEATVFIETSDGRNSNSMSDDLPPLSD